MSKSNRTDTPLRAARAQISNPEITVHATYRSAIGIDVHLNLLVCCHQKQVEGHCEQSESRDFNTDRASIDAFAAWCRECNPDIILMESTGSLWQSPYDALERAGFTSERLALINARDAKAAAGKNGSCGGGDEREAEFILILHWYSLRERVEIGRRNAESQGLINIPA